MHILLEDDLFTVSILTLLVFPFFSDSCTYRMCFACLCVCLFMIDRVKERDVFLIRYWNKILELVFPALLYLPKIGTEVAGTRSNCYPVG